tara:strand:+ start:2895 stop:3338 length:444 start_codon:yes stop_codon:yes gene_type:complete
MNNSKTIFLDTNLNYDLTQCQDLQKNKSNLENSYNSNNNSNNLNTLIEAKEYIGCIGNKCTLINEEKVNNNLLNKKILNFNSNSNSNSINNNTNTNNSMLNSIIEFIYLVTIILLLINCFLHKNVYNLITILIITLVFVFYKIYNNI